MTDDVAEDDGRGPRMGSISERPPLPPDLQFPCVRLTDCRKCQHRHEAANARVGSKSPRKPLDVRRPMPTPRRSAKHSCQSPVSQDKAEEVQPCQQIMDLLALFTKRIQGFFSTLMGFNHPHMDRLEIALQQQVRSLAEGLMAVMTKQRVFLSIRSAAREKKLWDLLRKRHASFFERGQQLKGYVSAASEEAAMKQAALASCVLARGRAEKVGAFAAKLRQDACLQAAASACWQGWRRFARTRAQTRKAVRTCRPQTSDFKALSLQSSFLHWQRARSTSDRNELNKMKARAAKSQSSVELCKVRVFLDMVLRRSTATERSYNSVKCLMVWQLFAAQSRLRRLQEGAQELSESLRKHFRQNVFKLWNRRAQKAVAKVAFAHWLTETACSAVRTCSSAAAWKAASFGARIVERRRELGFGHVCFVRWAAFCKISSELPRPSAEARSTYAQEVSASPHEAAYRGGDFNLPFHPFRFANPGASSHQSAYNFMGHHEQTHAMPLPSHFTVARPWSATDPRMAKCEVPQGQGRWLDAELVSYVNESSQEVPEAMKHWSLASQASMSEEGYLKLLDFHRERAREKRRMGIG